MQQLILQQVKLSKQTVNQHSCVKVKSCKPAIKMRGYKCEKCEHTASRRSSLVQHVERVHGDHEEDRSVGSGVNILQKVQNIIYLEVII